MYLIRQGSRVYINTPAKLNLFLEVHRRRADGFHDLETLMVPINLFDSLSIEASSLHSDISLNCKWVDGITSDQQTELPAEQDNIVSKALELLREAADVNLGANVELVKRIPAQAGLGGGSSDAAAALLAANEVWGIGFSLPTLAELGAKVGSDVPFFLFDSAEHATSLVRCTGRGEILSPVPVAGSLSCVVVKPDFGLSTPKVFANVSVPSHPNSSRSVVDRLATFDLRGFGNAMFNRLQEAAAKICPWIDEVSSHFNKLPVLAHQLSASGTSYFAVCRNLRQARQVAGRLRATNLGRTFVTTTLGPSLVR